MTTLIVGLGNPGADYAGHRHSVGFMAAEAIAGQGAVWRAKFQGLFCKTDAAYILKPQTFMNESGRSVGALAAFYKIPPSRIFVLHDELDLVAGKVKVKCGGGNAGHNGLRSVEAHLGTADFWRVRIGIGHPGDRARVHGYVLSDFAKTDAVWLEPLLEDISAHLPLLLGNKPDMFMARLGGG